jgi:hypothetical protein
VTRADRRIAVGLFIVTFVTFAYFFSGGGWNQNAQWDLTRALVEQHKLHIDDYRRNTGDLSWSNSSGTWYAFANKPPGVSMLAAIPYALIYRWQLSNATNAYLVTVLTCGVCGALIPVVLYLYGARRRRLLAPRSESDDRRRRTPDVAVALTIAFGTIVFPYSTMLFAHVPAALFLLLAFVWLDERPLLAGVCAGIASLCFYICIPAALVLALSGAAGSQPTAKGRRAKSPPLHFILGGLPFAILLGAYHYVCFGSPWRTSVAGSRNFTQEGLLLGVFRKPSLEALWGLTFSEYRGLFFVSPILLLALVGAIVMIRKRVMLRELATIGAIFMIFLVAIASFNGWEGGFAFGPRYLLPVIPLLAIPMLFAWRNVFLIVALLSVAIQFVATAVNPMPDGAIRHPLRAYMIPSFAHGQLSVNEQGIDDLLPVKGSRWAAFNLGEFFLPAAVSWIPIALWIVGGSAWLIRKSP